jgi:hypothetical protein
MVCGICQRMNKGTYPAADPPQRIIIRGGHLPDNFLDRGGDWMTFEGPLVPVVPFAVCGVTFL